MIAFTYQEIADSILFAIGFGVGFSVLYSAVLLLRSIIFSLPDIFCSIFVFDKILPLPSFSEIGKGQKVGKILCFFSVVLFFVGFCLLSYIALDGIIRIYMLVLCSAAFYLSKITIFEFFIKVFLFIFRFVLRLFTLVIRIIVSPVKRLKSLIFRIKLRTK